MEQQILARKRMVKAEEYIPVIRGLVEEGNIVPFLIITEGLKN